MLRGKWASSARFVSLFISTLLAPGFGSTAWSQQSPTNTSGGESSGNSDSLTEVVVTATRREEQTQKVPVAVAAIDSAELEKAGIQNFSDLEKLTPSLAVAQAPGGFNFINIRGVGVGVATPFQSAGVPLMVDGMYLPHSENFIQSEYFDIDRVEVYRGPQGTFAGQNSTGGAIFVTTAQPQFDDFGAWAQQLVGSYHWYQTQAALNLPITDQWSSRIALNAEKRDGYTTNLGPDGPAGITSGAGEFGNPGNLDRLDVRMILRFRPNENLDFRLHYDDVNENDNGPADIPDNNTAAFYTPTGGTNQGNYNDPRYIPNPRTVSYDYPSSRDLRISRTILNTEWHLSDALELKAVTGYQFYHYVTAQDSDYGSPYPGALNYSGPVQVAVGNTTRDNYYTQEFDLLSTGDSRWQWVIGADAYHEVSPIHTDVSVYTDGPLTPAGVPAYPAAPYGAANPFAGEILNYYQQDTSYAGFGELTFKPTDQFELIAGGRWTYYEVEVDPGSDITSPTAPFAVLPSCLGSTYPAPYSGPTGTGGLCNISARAPYSEPSGRLVGTWYVTPGTTLYTSASHGFKQGAYVTQYDEGQGQHSGYLPERINDYEAGIKTTTLDQHLRINADGFYEDYFNYQTPYSVPGASVPLTLNTQEAKLYGTEASIDFALQGFKASINADYLHTEIAKDTTPSVVPSMEYGPYDPLPAQHFTCTVFGITSDRCVTFTGESMIYAPKFIANAALSYDFHVPGGTLTPYVLFSYIDSQWATLYHASQDFIPAHATLDLRVTYALSEHWRVEAFATNVTDRLYILGVAAGQTVPYEGAVLFGDPRQMGIRVMYRH
jgi:iron complex outermembrane receptor protein